MVVLVVVAVVIQPQFMRCVNEFPTSCWRKKELEKPSQNVGEEHETKIFIAPKLLKLERFGFHQCVEETIFYLEGYVKPI